MTSNKLHVWDYCPPEILTTILKFTDYKTLHYCLQVNKHWRDVAIYTGDKYGLWEQFVNNKMTNGGVSFKQKTTLKWLEMYKNSLLWYKIDSAKINLYQTYNVANISKINVYRDNLIIISPNEVKYFHIETCNSIRSIQTSCIDYDETDYIILEVKLQDNLNYKTLALCGKSCPTQFECDKQRALVLNDVLHYKLEHEFCYVLDERNVIWQHRWDHKTWKTNALSRYYGQPYTVKAFNVYQKEVCLLTANGNVYRTDRSQRILEKLIYVGTLESADIEFEIILPTIYKYDPIGKKELLAYSLLVELDLISQRVPVAARNHGDAVIKAFDDGFVRISVYDHKAASSKISFQEFNVRQFQSLSESVTIVSLNVYEANKSHHVFVATNKCVFQVQLLHVMNNS